MKKSLAHFVVNGQDIFPTKSNCGSGGRPRVFDVPRTPWLLEAYVRVRPIEPAQEAMDLHQACMAVARVARAESQRLRDKGGPDAWTRMEPPPSMAWDDWLRMHTGDDAPGNSGADREGLRKAESRAVRALAQWLARTVIERQVELERLVAPSREAERRSWASRLGPDEG